MELAPHTQSFRRLVRHTQGFIRLTSPRHTRTKSNTMGMKRLINLSNHPSTSWSEAQKDGWDMVVDVKFPSVNPTLDGEGVHELVSSTLQEVYALTEGDEELNLCLMGEFSFVIEAVKYLSLWGPMKPVILWVPTSERVAVETVNPDGTVTKTSQFKFVRWRSHNILDWLSWEKMV